MFARSPLSAVTSKTCDGNLSTVRSIIRKNVRYALQRSSWSLGLVGADRHLGQSLDYDGAEVIGWIYIETSNGVFGRQRGNWVNYHHAQGKELHWNKLQARPLTC